MVRESELTQLGMGRRQIATIIGCTRRRFLALTKGRDAEHVVGNHSGVIVPDGASRRASDQNVWV